MSETEVRETELVTGTIESVITKGEGKWQIVVKPDGSQYTKNLWTKSQSHMEAATAKSGQHGGFPVLGLALDEPGRKAGTVVVARGHRGGWGSKPPKRDRESSGRSPAAAPRASTDGMTKEEWARKDAAIHKMACIKTAAAVLTHTLPSDPTPEDMGKFLAALVDARRVLVRLGDRGQGWIRRDPLLSRSDPETAAS